jgi:hypothetical protein
MGSGSKYAYLLNGRIVSKPLSNSFYRKSVSMSKDSISPSVHKSVRHRESNEVTNFVFQSMSNCEKQPNKQSFKPLHKQQVFQ